MENENDFKERQIAFLAEHYMKTMTKKQLAELLARASVNAK